MSADVLKSPGMASVLPSPLHDGWGVEVWGQDSAKKLDSEKRLLQPWLQTTSEKPVSPEKLLSKERKRPSSAKSKDPPSSLANRVNRRIQLKANKEAEKETDADQGPYQFSKDDTFEGTPEEKSQPLLLAGKKAGKKVTAPPGKSELHAQLRKPARALAGGNVAEPPPYVQLYQGQNPGSLNKGRSISPPPVMIVEAKCVQSQADVHTRQAPHRARTPEATQNAKDFESVADSLADGTPYVMHDKAPRSSRTWLEDAMDRTQRADSPLRGMEGDKYVQGPNGFDEAVVASAAAAAGGLSLHPIIFERLNEKEREQQREIERGGMVKGTALSMQSTEAVTTARKDSRLRTLLKEATKRQSHRKSDLNNASSHDQAAASLIAKEPSNGFPEEPGQTELVQPATPVASVPVCIMDAATRRNRRPPLAVRSHAAAVPRSGLDPFALVRTEEQRRTEEDWTKEAAPRSMVLATTAVATTVIKTSIPPEHVLQGKSTVAPTVDHGDLEMRDGKRSSSAQHKVADATKQTNLSPAREVYSINSMSDKEGCTFFSTEKAHIETRRRLASPEGGEKGEKERGSGGENGRVPTPCNEQHKKDISYHERGDKEEPVVVAKLPVNPIEHIPKGQTDEELMYLIKTQTARERFEIEKEQMLTRRLDARILGESEAVIDDTIARGVQGWSKPALPKAARARNDKAGTSLGAPKELSVGVDLNELQSRTKYLGRERPHHPISAHISPQHRISQAYSDDRQRVATANDGVNSIKEGDEHSLAALLATLPSGHPRSEQAADIPSAKSRNTSARSAKSGPPRIGAVKCVPRPASATAACSTGTATSTPARPQSAAAMREEQGLLSSQPALYLQHISRPASAPAKRAASLASSVAASAPWSAHAAREGQTGTVISPATAILPTSPLPQVSEQETQHAIVDDMRVEEAMSTKRQACMQRPALDSQAFDDPTVDSTCTPVLGSFAHESHRSASTHSAVERAESGDTQHPAGAARETRTAPLPSTPAKPASKSTQSMSATQLATQYSDMQCAAKQRVAAEVMKLGRESAQEPRRLARLQHLAALEQHRQHVQNQTYDPHLNMRMLVGRENAKSAGDPPAGDGPEAGGEDLDANDLHQLVKNTADTHIEDLQQSAAPIPDAQFVSMLCAAPLPPLMSSPLRHAALEEAGRQLTEEAGRQLTEEVGRREEKLSTDKARDDYEHNRILASHAAHGGRAAPAPQNRSTSDFFQESEDEDGMALPSPLKEVGRSVGGAAGSCGVRSSRESPLGGRVGVGSPLGSPLGQRSPLDSPLGRFRRRRRGNQGIDNALQEEPQEPPRRNEYGHNSYESQEALVQILGLPSQTHLAEMAKSKVHHATKKIHVIHSFLDEAWHEGGHRAQAGGVAYRTSHSVQHVDAVREQLAKRKVCKSSVDGVHDKLSWMRLQTLGLDESNSLVRNTERDTLTHYDLEPVFTGEGLHTTSASGSVHVQDQHSVFPHKIVYKLDMSKTKGPLHKEIDGRATRMLVVMLVNFSGDADMVVTANNPSKEKPTESWHAARYWGTLADAGFSASHRSFAAVLQGKKHDYASWAIISPKDQRYVNSHQVDQEALLAAVQHLDLEARVAKRKEIEETFSRGPQLQDRSVFYITVTGVDALCNFCVLTRTMFFNELPNPKLQKFISNSVTEEQDLFKALKSTSIDCSQLRVHFVQHGASFRKSLHTQDDTLAQRVHAVIFNPLLEHLQTRMNARKKGWNSKELSLQKQLTLREETKVLLASDENRQESEDELWQIWSSFTSIHSVDSKRTKMNFDQLYLLLFYLGLVASPDFDNCLGISDKRMLFTNVDAEVTWEKVYPAQGRTGARMNFVGFLDFMKLTSRRCKLTFAQILNYPVTTTFAKGEPNEELMKMRTPAAVNDSRGAKHKASCRTHHCWVGSYSASVRLPAEKSGYEIQPLATEDDFMVVESEGLKGVGRSTDFYKALSNPPPSRLPNPEKESERERIESEREEATLRVRRVGSGQGRGEPGEQQEGGTWSEKDENCVRMLLMKKRMEYFGANAQPEDPDKCTPCLVQVLGNGPTFFRRNFIAGTAAYDRRLREEWAATKIQARFRGMCARGKMARERNRKYARLDHKPDQPAQGRPKTMADKLVELENKLVDSAHQPRRLWHLKIGLIRAQQLPKMDATGSADPYVTFDIHGKKQRSKIIQNTLNPEWNEEFVFEVDADHNTKLTLKLWDSDRASEDDGIGEVSFKLANLSGSSSSGTFKLKAPGLKKFVKGIDSEFTTVTLSFSASNVMECDLPNTLVA